jgi:hypothetical protein
MTAVLHTLPIQSIWTSVAGQSLHLDENTYLSVKHDCQPERHCFSYHPMCTLRRSWSSCSFEARHSHLPTMDPPGLWPPFDQQVCSRRLKAFWLCSLWQNQLTQKACGEVRQKISPNTSTLYFEVFLHSCISFIQTHLCAKYYRRGQSGHREVGRVIEQPCLMGSWGDAGTSVQHPTEDGGIVTPPRRDRCDSFLPPLEPTAACVKKGIHHSSNLGNIISK